MHHCPHEHGSPATAPWLNFLSSVAPVPPSSQGNLSHNPVYTASPPSFFQTPSFLSAWAGLAGFQLTRTHGRVSGSLALISGLCLTLPSTLFMTHSAPGKARRPKGLSQERPQRCSWGFHCSVHVLDTPGPREAALCRVSTCGLCRQQPGPSDGHPPQH